MDEVPEDRCGYSIEPELLPREPGRVCCWRPKWRNNEWCIWHADESQKPINELIHARTEYPERLDGAILREKDVGGVSFSMCCLVEADLSNSHFINTDFSGANLQNANLSKVHAEGATFREANLFRANLSNSMLASVDFRNTFSVDVDFFGSQLGGARFSEADIRESCFHQANLFGNDFTDVNLKKSDLSSANIGRAIFHGAHLSGADFTNSRLWDSNLTKVNASDVDFSGTDFADGDLTDANARGATFDGAILEDATFVRTELRDANLRDTRLYQTLFADTRINSNTDFGEKSAYEDPDTDLGEQYDDTSHWEAAAWVYRRLQDLHEENAMSEKAREYHVRKEEAHRSDYWEKGKYFQWFIYTLNLALTNHGESVKRVVYWSIGVILACALAYPFTGGIATGNEVFRATSISALSLGLVLRSLYFSTVTFTTLGYGDYHPVGEWSKALAGAESLAGALLVALFVFVLGRRVAR